MNCDDSFEKSSDLSSGRRPKARSGGFSKLSSVHHRSDEIWVCGIRYHQKRRSPLNLFFLVFSCTRHLPAVLETQASGLPKAVGWLVASSSFCISTREAYISVVGGLTGPFMRVWASPSRRVPPQLFKPIRLPTVNPGGGGRIMIITYV